ncbi:MAG: hypothetical protein M1834_007375 [Cirrosporium novae-zelandiae]|nr:MAG: hypothetical protein M1834_007375 [Cirrosporium novae-zelandiae]
MSSIHNSKRHHETRADHLKMKSQMQVDKGKIENLEVEIAKLKEENNNLKRTNEQQKRTIKVQSDEIATPKKVRCANCRQLMNHTPGAPPPSFNLPSRSSNSSITMTANTLQIQAPKLPPRDHSQTIHSSSSTATLTVPTMSGASRPSSRNMSHITTPTQAGSQSGALVLVGNGSDESEASVSAVANIRNLWGSVELFVNTHITKPNEADRMLPESTFVSLAKVSNVKTIPYLLKDGYYRPLLIAGFLNSMLVSHVVKSSAFKGLSVSTDDRMGQIHNQLFSNTPPIARRVFQEEMALLVKNLKRRPTFDSFVTSETTRLAQKIFQIISPLCGSSKSAWTELYKLVSQAYRLAYELYSLPCDWKFDFPKYEEYFNQTSMLNRDRKYQETPSGLMRRKIKVQLGFTPITVKRWVADSAIRTEMIGLASVLLMD